jgi:hypothetical protein
MILVEKEGLRYLGKRDGLHNINEFSGILRLFHALPMLLEGHFDHSLYLLGGIRFPEGVLNLLI